MQSHQHLKDRTHYEDLYDERTVEECLYYEENFQKKVLAEIRKLPEKDQKGAIPNVPYIVAGERYIKRDETIRGWMERDEHRDQTLADAKQPYSFCPDCSEMVKCIHKSIRYQWDDEPERVEFMLHCESCKKAKRVYEDGEEVPPIIIKCDKCGHELDTDVEIKTKGKRKTVIYTESCSGCGYKSVKEDKEPKPPTKAEKEKFEQDKARFCFSCKEGMEYQEWRRNLDAVTAYMKDRENHEEAYNSVQDYKQLSMVALLKHLKPMLKKKGYDKMRFAEPDMGKYVTVDFKIQDTSDNRGEHESKKYLKKALQEALADTNWSLMSQAITYRLGILTGRLKGHESRDQLIELAKSRTTHGA